MSCFLVFFFFNDTATTEIYTLSLHDALPISGNFFHSLGVQAGRGRPLTPPDDERSAGRPAIVLSHMGDRKSTRLNSSHSQISYAVFCLKKKNKKRNKMHDNTCIRPTLVQCYT